MDNQNKAQKQKQGPHDSSELTKEQKMWLREITDDFTLPLNKTPVKAAIKDNPFLYNVESYKLVNYRRNMLKQRKRVEQERPSCKASSVQSMMSMTKRQKIDESTDLKSQTANIMIAVPQTDD